MARRKAIPHCRLLRAADIKTGMMVSVRPVTDGLSSQYQRKFYDVVKVWPVSEDGFIGLKRIMAYGKTTASRHKSDDRLLVRITNRAPRRGKTQ